MAPNASSGQSPVLATTTTTTTIRPTTTSSSSRPALPLDTIEGAVHRLRGYYFPVSGGRKAKSGYIKRINQLHALSPPALAKVVSSLEAIVYNWRYEGKEVRPGKTAEALVSRFCSLADEEIAVQSARREGRKTQNVSQNKRTSAGRGKTPASRGRGRGQGRTLPHVPREDSVDRDFSVDLLYRKETGMAMPTLGSGRFDDVESSRSGPTVSSRSSFTAKNPTTPVKQAIQAERNPSSPESWHSANESPCTPSTVASPLLDSQGKPRSNSKRPREVEEVTAQSAFRHFGSSKPVSQPSFSSGSAGPSPFKRRHKSSEGKTLETVVKASSSTSFRASGSRTVSNSTKNLSFPSISSSQTSYLNDGIFSPTPGTRNTTPQTSFGAASPQTSFRSTNAGSSFGSFSKENLVQYPTLPVHDEGSETEEDEPMLDVPMPVPIPLAPRAMLQPQPSSARKKAKQPATISSTTTRVKLVGKSTPVKTYVHNDPKPQVQSEPEMMELDFDQQYLDALEQFFSDDDKLDFGDEKKPASPPIAANKGRGSPHPSFPDTNMSFFSEGRDPEAEAVAREWEEEAIEREEAMEEMEWVKPDAPAVDEVDVGDDSFDTISSFSSSVVQEVSRLNIDLPPPPHVSYDELPFWIKYEALRAALMQAVPYKGIDEKMTDVLKRTGFGDRLIKTSTARTKFRDVVRQFAEHMAKDQGAKSTTKPETIGRKCWQALVDKSWAEDLCLSGTLEFAQGGSGSFAFKLKEINHDWASTRFLRRFGNDRFMSVALPSFNVKDLPARAHAHSRRTPEALRIEVIEWLVNEELHVLNRKWRCFFITRSETKKTVETWDEILTKTEVVQNAVFFAESGEGLGDVSEAARNELGEEIEQACRKEFSREDLLMWHIPMGPNMSKTVNKVWSRIPLGNSTSRPTVTFTWKQIELVPDKLSPTGEIMDDGCSLCSPEVLRMVRDYFNLDETPTSIQGRIGGAKGVWTADTSGDRDELSKDVWIKITESQLKYPFHEEDKDEATADPSRLTLDVLTYSKEPKPASLNLQFVRVLEKQGVPYDSFKDLLLEELDENFKTLINSMDNPALLRAWLYERERIVSDRVRQGGINLGPGGLPIFSAEVLILLLEASFKPRSCAYMMQALQRSVARNLDDIMAKFHVKMPKSCSLICIADPTGTLEEGEVSLQFSKGILDPKTQRRQECLEGDILVGRNPAHLPSDIQKVRAISSSNRVLRQLKDVIVFSAKGNRSLASLLSGGDYDGDKPWVCWDPRFVEPFKNSRSTFTIFDEKKYFENENQTLRELTSGKLDKKHLAAFFKKGFESSLQDQPLGICTVLHEKLSYLRKGVLNVNVAILAKLCSVLVDAPKQGLRPNARFAEFIAEMQQQTKQVVLHYKDPAGEHPPLSTAGPLDWCIPDRLVFSVARSKVAELKSLFLDAVNTSKTLDDDLTSVWKSTHERATSQTRRLHPEALKHQFLDAADARKASDLPVDEVCNLIDRSLEGMSATHLVLLQLQDDLRDLFTEWQRRVKLKENQQLPPGQFQNVCEDIYARYVAIQPNLSAGPEVAHDPVVKEWCDEDGFVWSRLKASAVSYMFHNRGFCWHMAAQELCSIKAEKAGGRARVVVPELYTSLGPHRAFLRGLEEEEEA